MNGLVLASTCDPSFRLLCKKVQKAFAGNSANLQRLELESMNSLASRLRLFRGNISSLDCEAIVTAANNSLCGGGGVDGAVHAAAEPRLVRASMAVGPCPTGEARITDGFELNAKYVIHAVGPVFNDLARSGRELASAYEFCSTAGTEAQDSEHSLSVYFNRSLRLPIGTSV